MRWLATGAVGCLALIGWSATQGVPARSEAAAAVKPNVVILSVDTLRRDALRAFATDAEPHPAFDALAARSAVFTRAVSTAAWTPPAHASLFTGLYPDRHGATDHRARLATGIPTLAELLAADGYQTVAFTDGGFLGPMYQLDRGFQRFNHAATTPEVRIDVPRGGLPSAPRGKEIFDRGIAYLQQRGPDGPPLFLFLHTFSVHDYYRIGVWAAPELRGSFKGWDHYRSCLVGNPPCDAEDWDLLRRVYALEVRRADAALGQLLATLQERLTGRPTILVLLSDHGEGFSPATGVVHHAGNLVPEVVRVPLLVSGPGLRPGDNSTPISLIDVMPTLLELIGIEAPQGLDGVSLARSWQTGPAAPVKRRTLFALEHAHTWSGLVRHPSKEVRASPFSAAAIEDDLWIVAGPEGDRVLLPSGAPSSVAAPASRLRALREWVRLRRRLEVQREVLPTSDELTRELQSLGYA